MTANRDCVPPDSEPETPDDADHPDDEVIFYQLPARDLAAGMSTIDCQDYLDVSPPDEDGTVWTYVYTAHEDPRQDAINRSCEVTRCYPADEMVDLAVFIDTEVDGSELPSAVIVNPATLGQADS
jgi:hypothetical protein